MMERLPNELTLNYLGRLSAVDLAAYCATSSSTMAICEDDYFWSQKLRSLPRKELQDDWFLKLTSEGHYRLLWSLCRALDKRQRGWIIDEYAVVLALIILASKPSRDRSSKLESYLHGKTTVGRHSGLYHYYYFGSDPTVAAFKPNTMDDYIRLLGIRLNSIIRDLNADQSRFFDFRKISLHPVLQAYEQNLFESKIDRSLPSASSWLAEVLGMPTHRGRTGPIVTLYNYILPSLMSKGSMAQLEVYLIDLTARTPYIRNLFDNLDLTMADYDPIEFFFHLTSRFATKDTIEQLLDVADRDWSVFNTETQFGGGFHYRDPEVYKAIVENADDDEEFIFKIVGGYTCMEPEEWIIYFQSLELSEEERTAVLAAIPRTAKSEGYTYFSEVVSSLLGGE